MGDMFFKSVYYKHRGDKLDTPHKHDFEIRSEDLGAIINNGRDDIHGSDRKSLQRIVNGSNGIYYYETSVWDKKELKKQLHKLVDEI